MADRDVLGRQALGLVDHGFSVHLCTIFGADHMATRRTHVWCMSDGRDLEQWRMSFGRHLREVREAGGLTQEALAAIAGVDRKLIYRTELGQTSPRLDAVVRIADALGVEPSSLLPD